MLDQPIAQIKGLKVAFQTKDGPVVGVKDVSFDVNPGETVCIVGESGSGKSVTSLSLMRLVEFGGGHIDAGQLIFDRRDGEHIDVASADQDLMRQIRGNEIGMIFQEPMTSLNPVFTVGRQLTEGLRVHKGLSKDEAEERALVLLREVRIPEPERRLQQYPHELSGGMQQRVGLARALAANPDVLLMDEPFSALDPLIRRQLQDEFIRLSKILKKTTIFITHDLDEAVRIGDRIAIMRDGKMVQMGTAEDIVMHPADDYVADFVAGISRLKVVHAHAVMQPLTAYGPIAADAPRVGQNETLSNLINLAIGDEKPIVVQTDGLDQGVITRADLLRTVIEGTEVS